MKRRIILTTLVLQSLFSYSQVKRNGINYEREAMRKCFIIPMDSIQRELGRLYLGYFGVQFMKEKFSNQVTDITIELKKNGKIKRIIFEKEEHNIASNEVFRNLTKKYIKELQYFNIYYRDELNKNLRLKKAYLFLSFDEKGRIIPKWY